MRTDLVQRLCVLSFILLLAAPVAGASSRVEVLETHPASPATLGHWEQIYLRIAYEADVPVRVRAHAYAGEQRMDEMTSGSPLYEAGRGVALFWFAWTKPARIDRIVVYAEDVDSGRQVARTQLAVDVTATGEKTATQTQRPEWVKTLLADQKRRHDRAYQQHPGLSTSWWWLVVFQLVMLSIPTYFILQGILLWRWRGGWRIAAAVPAVIMFFPLAHAIFALFAGSNLWPIVLIFTAPVALIYLLVLMFVRSRWLRARAAT